MAGDWIKMRTDLYRDPKVIVIADFLMAKDSELSRYVNQILQRDMTVTRNVMRNVTVGALVAVWGVARHQGYRSNNDLRIDDVTLSVIDDIADLPGFGQAMEDAGWLMCDDVGLCFPRFYDEHNVDPKEAQKKKNAERQRRYREKKRNVTEDVTRNVTVTHREEKRREEINKEKKKQKKKDSPGYSPEFEQFWESCPKRVGKANAWKAFPNALKLAATSTKRLDDETVAEFLTRRMRDYAAFVSDKDAQFVRHPSTWLNGGNWDDDMGSRVATDEELKKWRP